MRTSEDITAGGNTAGVELDEAEKRPSRRNERTVWSSCRTGEAASRARMEPDRHNADMTTMLLTMVDLRARREEILDIASRRGASNIAVFGSVARGEADEQSDVDILVDLEVGRSLLDLGGLLMDLREALGRDVDVVTRAGLRPRVRDRVLSEATPL